MSLQLSAPFETVEVEGQSLNFYPISLHLLFQLRPIARPVIQAISTLFRDGEKDQSTRHVKGHQQELIEYEAISPELAKQRDQERSQRADEVVDALFEPKSRWILVALFMDSLREEFPSRPINQAKAQKYLEANPDLSFQQVLALLRGVYAANKRVLDPLGIGGLSDSVKLKIAEAAVKTLETTTTGESEPGVD